MPSNASDNKQQYLNSNCPPSIVGFPTTYNNSVDNLIKISLAEVLLHYNTIDKEDVPKTSTCKETLSSLILSSLRNNLQSALILLS